MDRFWKQIWNFDWNNFVQFGETEGCWVVKIGCLLAWWLDQSYRSHGVVAFMAGRDICILTSYGTQQLHTHLTACVIFLLGQDHYSCHCWSLFLPKKNIYTVKCRGWANQSQVRYSFTGARRTSSLHIRCPNRLFGHVTFKLK